MRLRGGLSFELQEHGSQTCYVIHDELAANYFQIGVPEYALLSVLDGKTSLGRAVQETAYRLGEDSLSLRDAIRVGDWLIQSGLAFAVEKDGVTPVGNVEHRLRQATKQANQKIVSQLNPLFLKLPLGSPEPWLRLLQPWFGWLGSTRFLVIWFALVGFATFRLWDQSESLATAAQGLLAPQAWLWMGLTLVGLKIVHELAHGLVCNRLGGRVKETGLVFILFIPIPYVDVTSCWGFTSKWPRIAVAAAGMYAEIFLAATAAIAWSYSSDPVLRFHLFNVIIIGSVTTVLFNANFLMRFDGYYILADFCEAPNLYQKGQQFINGMGRRWILGIEGATAAFAAERKRSLIGSYGIAAWLWRILICVSLSILATALFYGFGVALSLAGIAMWIGVPTFRFARQFFDPIKRPSVNVRWIGFVTLPALAALIGAFCWLPWPAQVSAPAIVEYAQPDAMRVPTSGFVVAINVVEGDKVAEGDVLAVLENHELVGALEQLRLDREMSLVRSRGFHQEQEVAAYQSENAQRVALEQQIAELESDLELLTVRATTDGIVIGQALQSLEGQYLNKGAPLMRVVREDSKKLIASVSQDDVETFESARGGEAVFAPRHRLADKQVIGSDETGASAGRTHDHRLSSFLTRAYQPRGKLALVEPTARFSVDARLTSYAGGPLAVRPAGSRNSSHARSSNSAASIGNNHDAPELVAPRFECEVLLSPVDAAQLRAGLTGVIRLQMYNETIASHVVKSTRRWIASCFQAAAGGG